MSNHLEAIRKLSAKVLKFRNTWVFFSRRNK